MRCLAFERIEHSVFCFFFLLIGVHILEMVLCVLAKIVINCGVARTAPSFTKCDSVQTVSIIKQHALYHNARPTEQ